MKLFLNHFKRIIEKVTGYWIFKTKYLPVGTDLKIDLKRLSLIDCQIVFDVGANVGQTANLYQKMFKNANIYSFEPVRASYNKLVDNTKSNKMIHPINIGFGDVNKVFEMKLDHDPTSTTNTLNPNFNKASDHEIEKVEIKTLDSFCTERNINKIDFLKIDTEGWEINVLNGALGMINRGNIKAILCEVGFTSLNVRNTPFEVVNHFMAKNNYFFYGIFDTSHIKLKKGTHYANALFVSENYLKSID